MLHRLFITIMSVVVCIAADAQEICTINGTIADSKLENGKKIKEVSLIFTNELGQPVEVAKTKVKKGKYSFSYELANDEPILMYTIGGFGDGKSIEVFVEPGLVTVNTASASMPCLSHVSGTPTNDAYSAYKSLLNNRQSEIDAAISRLEASRGKEWLESAEGKSEVKRIKALESISTQSQILKFLIEHNTSPMTPFLIERTLLPKLTSAYAEQMTKTISALLHNHPYYHSLRNQVLSNNLKVGNEVPNIMLPLANGETKNLVDYRGKYVVLNYWKEGCEKSKEMLAELQNLYDVIKGNNADFVIMSVSLGDDIEAWKSVIESSKINREGWFHACDGLGADSPAAKLAGVGNAPKIILIEPEGRAVSLDMEIDEVVMRVEQIIAGDLYYLDQE
ncbi:MAG: DUF4369 domain-containing protein [Bacteroidaceae bacterium]|nr:DUF4369 domain-containing protein [Bacteroidaceae bacterium]